MDTQTTLNPRAGQRSLHGLSVQGRRGYQQARQAEGITTTVGFHPERLESHQGRDRGDVGRASQRVQEVRRWRMVVPECLQRQARQSVDGFHQRMEQLFQLGIGIGKVQSQLPREMWLAPARWHAVLHHRLDKFGYRTVPPHAWRRTALFLYNMFNLCIKE